MATAIQKGAYTFEDFCSIVRDGQKADLIDGVMYMASPDNTDANDLFVWLLTFINAFVEEKALGKVYGSRVAFRLDEYNGPEPDIAFVAAHHLDRVQRGQVIGPPDLAIEIVSPESVERDYVKKRKQYERAGVHEYWIIDELESKVTFLRLGSKGKFREVRPQRGVLRSDALPGFWIEPSWLWQQPRPRAFEILTRLLGGGS